MLEKASPFERTPLYPYWTAYAKADDMTFIMKDLGENEYDGIEVVGFYFGEPNDTDTLYFKDKGTKAFDEYRKEEEEQKMKDIKIVMYSNSNSLEITANDRNKGLAWSIVDYTVDVMTTAESFYNGFDTIRLIAYNRTDKGDKYMSHIQITMYQNNDKFAEIKSNNNEPGAPVNNRFLTEYANIGHYVDGWMTSIFK